MKKMQQVIQIFLLVSLTSAFGGMSPITYRECRPGGDGPGPTYDISNQFSQDFWKLDTVGSVEEYMYWEKSDRVVYRNSGSAIFRKDVLIQQPQLFLGSLRSPIARLVDPDETRILAEKKLAYLDASDSTPNTWKETPAGYPLENHLFWINDETTGKDVLFSYGSEHSMSTGKQTIHISRWIAGEEKISKCVLKTNPGEKFYIGQGGHRFPEVFLYKVADTDLPGSSVTSFYSMKLTTNSSSGSMASGDLNCNTPYQLGDTVKMPGRVLSAYRYIDHHSTIFDAFIVKSDHPTDNVLWYWKGLLQSQCYYYNFNGRIPYVLVNGKVPLLTTWADGEGVTLVYPNKKKHAMIFKGLDAVGLREQDFWITTDGQRLFVAATSEMCAERKVHWTDLPKLEEYDFFNSPISSLLKMLHLT